MQWLGTHLIAEYILPGPLSLSMILHICIQSPTRLPIFVMRGKRVKCQVLKSRWKRQQTNLKCTNDPVVVSNLHHITFFCICYCMSSFLAGTICMLAFSHTQLIYTCTHGQLDTWYQYREYKVPMLTCIVTIRTHKAPKPTQVHDGFLIPVMNGVTASAKCWFHRPW